MLLPHLKLRTSSPSSLTASKSHQAPELELSNAFAEVDCARLLRCARVVWFLHLLRGLHSLSGMLERQPCYSQPQILSL